MAEACILTGIPRASICRYLAKMQKLNQISLVKFGLCPITKHKAGFYQVTKGCQIDRNSQSINPNLRPIL